MTGTERITSEQIGQLKSFVEAAARKGVKLALERVSNLDKEGLQRVIARGDELNEAVSQTVLEQLETLSVFDQYANEEVPSKRTYPKLYKVKPIADQVAVLRKLFPQLDTVDLTVVDGKLPEGAEGWFAIPRWKKLATTYPEAIAKVLETIAASSFFYNYYDGIIAGHIRQSNRSWEFWTKLGDQQKSNDILIVPAQFGKRHRGRSVRRAHKMFSGIEFGLGAFAGGIMLLTHPERLLSYGDLWIALAGDEMPPGVVGKFPIAPCLSFDCGDVEFGSVGVSSANGDYGSLTGFAPQIP